jgi:hypothetical protein
MKKALAGVLAVALAGVMAGSAMAQVPNVQVYFDGAYTQTQRNCPGYAPFTTPDSMYVVMNNWNMNITGVDFSIQYPGALVWLADKEPDPGVSIFLGQSPTGIAVAWANCCAPNGFLPVLALKPIFLWGVCDCNQGSPQAVVVGGYTPFGKTNPTAIRKEDFTEHAGVGMTSLICPGFIAVQPSTWGQVKALYR